MRLRVPPIYNLDPKFIIVDTTNVNAVKVIISPALFERTRNIQGLLRDDLRYITPEELFGHGRSVTSPFWVLGCMLYEAQYVRNPFSTVMKPKVNEEFIEITADGRRATSQISVGGSVMTHIQRGEKTASRVDLDTQVTRTFNKEGMKCEVRITTPGSQASCVRNYKRIDDDYQDNCL